MTDVQMQFGLILLFLVLGAVWIVIKGEDDD